MKIESFTKMALNVSLLGIAFYAYGVKIMQDREYHDQRMLQLDDLDETLVTLQGKDGESEAFSPWHELDTHLIQLQDTVAGQNLLGEFVSWQAAFEHYLTTLPHDVDPKIRSKLQLYVDMQADNDQMLAARFFEKVKKSPDFSAFHQTALTELMEEVMNAEATDPARG